MSIEVFSNNAQTTLAAPVSNSQTSITLATGTGALFPAPSAGQYFRLTLTSVGSGYREICFCTSRTTDTLTVTRGQDGTAANNFLEGDTAGNYPTGGTQAHLVQSEQLQAGTYTFAEAGGTVDAITATINSNLTALQDGQPFVIEAAGANTTPCTLTVTLGSTVIGPYPLIKGAAISLLAGDIPAAGYPMVINWSATLASFILQNAANGITQFSAVPVGTLLQLPCTSAPAGYLICNGQLLSRTTYSGLYAFAVASGNIAASDGVWTNGEFSPGDGFTTFRLPQLGGYFLRVLDNGNDIDAGRTIGTIQSGQNAAHGHPGSTVSISDPEHNHGGGGGSPTSSVTDNGTDIIQVSSPGGVNAANATGITATTTIASQGGNEARPINIAYPVFIKY